MGFGGAEAIKRMYAVLETLKLTVHPDKRYIGKTEKGFDFLGYRFKPHKLLASAVQSLTRLLERVRRLHEKGADSHRLRQYVQRWVSGVTVPQSFVVLLVW